MKNEISEGIVAEHGPKLNSPTSKTKYTPQSSKYLNEQMHEYAIPIRHYVCVPYVGKLQGRMEHIQNREIKA
jgi:hypothetical protein